MDDKLRELQEEVKKRVLVVEGENPAINIEDVLRVAYRAGLLYRYAQNGSTYEIRLTVDDPVVLVPFYELPEMLCRHIIERVKPFVSPEEIQAGNKVEEKKPETPVKKTRAKKK